MASGGVSTDKLLIATICTIQEKTRGSKRYSVSSMLHPTNRPNKIYFHAGRAFHTSESFGGFEKSAPPKASAGHGTFFTSFTLDNASATVLCSEGR